MTTKIFGSSRIYLKKSKRRSMRRYNKYRKKVVVPKVAVVPKVTAAENAENAKSTETAVE